MRITVRIAEFCMAVCALITWSSITETIAAGEDSDTLQVMVSIEKKLTFEGKPVKPEELPGKLKSAGAKPDTVIRILIQKNTNESMIKDISRALANAKYRKFVFTYPKQAEATVKEPAKNVIPQTKSRNSRR
ncbi:MAG: hypothetical protein A2283_07460 [Lentisphaerae bacterium RIFOXYA12_FULL_48_11]|nr:MAG: hypothetical protein A2283_07460 [Lentisphaerae bacterium RIFOXYA12_FULL_48_11]